MALSDAFNKAKTLINENQDVIKDKLAENSETVNNVIDSVKEKAKDLTPDSFDSKVDEGTAKAKEALGQLQNEDPAK